MNVYDIFFDGIAKVYAEDPDTAREILLEQLSKTPGLLVLDVGKATRVGGTAT
jgi:hypothetical protein